MRIKQKASSSKLTHLNVSLILTRHICHTFYLKERYIKEMHLGIQKISFNIKIHYYHNSSGAKFITTPNKIKQKRIKSKKNIEIVYKDTAVHAYQKEEEI